MIADRRLCLDRSMSRLVEESNPEAAFLLAAKGQEIAFEAVKRLGLSVRDGRVVQPSTEPEEATPTSEESGPVPTESVHEPAGEVPPEVPPTDAPVEPEREPIIPPESRRSRHKRT
jgi:hypothetical protein